MAFTGCLVGSCPAQRPIGMAFDVLRGSSRHRVVAASGPEAERLSCARNRIAPLLEHQARIDSESIQEICKKLQSIDLSTHRLSVSICIMQSYAAVS